MFKKFLNKCTNIYSKQQIRCIGRKEINIKNPEKEAQLPIFQYPVSQKSDRRVYVWGLADTGALGLGIKQTNKKNPNVKTPYRLSFAERHEVTDIACGIGFTAFAVKSTDKSKIFGTGVNTDSQIGCHETGKNKPEEVLYSPSPINISFQDEKSRVLKLSAGRAHLLVLSTEGLFTLGNNSFGQCGREIIEDEKYSGSSIVHYISTEIQGQKIVDVQCGMDHSLLLTEKGEVYSCGWGADGQTGLGHYNIESRFSRMAGDLKGEVITKVACTVDCVLALNDKGEVFGWGNSEYGQLTSNSDVQQINTPIRLTYCKNLGKIVDVAAGGSFCMALNEEGNVFIWGYGLLGTGPKVQQSFKPILIPSILFGTNEFQKDTKVISLCCGVSHMGALTNTGDLYMWGKNRNGCLGLGHKNDQYFPLKVAVGGSVEKFSCGFDHSAALCKPFI